LLRHVAPLNLELGLFSVLVSRLHAAAGALFPPKGEEKKSKVEAKRHRRGDYQPPRRAIIDRVPAPAIAARGRSYSRV
jgi:hypothetical protein